MTAGPLCFPDPATLSDLGTFAGRAQRADPGGVARLIGHGDVLAVYASPVHGGGGPTVLGLRTLRLATPSAADVTVSLAALVAAVHAAATDPSLSSLPAPPAVPAGPGWAGTSPPRRGWQAAGAVQAAVLAERAAAGIAEVATGAPAGSGASAVAALRARVWGRPLADDLADLPAGVAFALTVLGFADGAPAAVYRCGPWWRVTTSAGHVLARRPALLAG